ncbi:MAG: hypothetical protein JW755_11655 [Candidatus Aminicenantes bacterium]|nr:hypothetical protein [Candidatus Aminicenantes bacterium]
MIELKENYDTHPICPFCSTDLGTIHYQEMRAFLGKRYIYFCPNCRKVLGVSHRKGFWMG